MEVFHAYGDSDESSLVFKPPGPPLPWDFIFLSLSYRADAAPAPGNWRVSVTQLHVSSSVVLALLIGIISDSSVIMRNMKPILFLYLYRLRMAIVVAVISRLQNPMENFSWDT